MPESQVKAMYPDEANRPKGGFQAAMEKVGDQDEASYISVATASEDQIYTEDLPSQGEHDEVDEGALDQGNIIQTVKIDAFKLKRQLPGDVNQIKNVNVNQANIPLDEFANEINFDPDDYKREIATPDIKSGSRSAIGRKSSLPIDENPQN